MRGPRLSLGGGASRMHSGLLRHTAARNLARSAGALLRGSALEERVITANTPDATASIDLGRHRGRPSNDSEAARKRMLADRREPFLYGNWDNAVFIHYEADPTLLQRCVPFALDLFEGRAFVSVVAFTLREMRPRLGGKLSELLFKPIATHNFFNVRAYVRDHGERAIFFMSEWLSNRLSVALGPSTFGLPYRYGRINYQNRHIHDEEVRGQVVAKEGCFSYRARLAGALQRCAPGSLDEFLLERYTAFTAAGRRRQFFRVWHEPWAQTAIEVDVTQDELLAATGNWWPGAQLLGANYSPGVNVWMGRPHPVAAGPFSLQARPYGLGERTRLQCW